MPTFDKLASFLRDWSLLLPQQKASFMMAVGKMLFDLNAGQGFHSGLRIKGVQGIAGVYEMTWADDGRATFEYGSSPHQGDVHIIWRRIGKHTILKNP